MLYSKNKKEKLSLELFKNPTAEYRGTPFCMELYVNKEQLEQIDILKKWAWEDFIFIVELAWVGTS